MVRPICDNKRGQLAVALLLLATVAASMYVLFPWQLILQSNRLLAGGLRMQPVARLRRLRVDLDSAAVKPSLCSFAVKVNQLLQHFREFLPEEFTCEVFA